MSNLIDNLINVTISISNAVTNEESFNNILLVGEAPSGEDSDASGVLSFISPFSSLSTIAACGWSTDSETYKAAAIAFRNGASRLYIAFPEDEEIVTDVLDRAVATSGWYGFVVVGENIDSADYESYAEWAENNNKLFGYVADCESEITNPVTGEYNYAIGIATKTLSTNTDNAYLAIAYLAKCMTYEAGSETWAYKTLSGVTTDAWTEKEITSLKAANLNYYVTVASNDITLTGKVLSGEYIDIIRFRDWLLSDMQSRIYKVFLRNAKVPYTDKGIALIRSAMVTSLKEGQAMGGIAETSYDEDGNETEGYTVSVPTAASISDSDRAARTLYNCKFTARLTGAIHLVSVTGTLST